MNGLILKWLDFSVHPSFDKALLSIAEGLMATGKILCQQH